ncbi:MAG TPA: hypothetical protein VKM55_15835 [Candidatus Lokiarchaeia archaeon]|nr:hypothetical protein [Candidatus Lokiarchaeia archaeon]
MNHARLDQVADALESMYEMDENVIFPLIGMFNHAMLDNVDGPNCTDRNTCNNNCCSIMIDIPQFLGRKYIEDGRLRPADLRRGDAFAWKLNVNEDTSRCVFFSPEIYGCRIYVDDLESRPPQCAIYPASYTTGAIACKAGAGPWIVKDEEIGHACERLMNVYKNYCLVERESVKGELLENIVCALETRLISLLDHACPSSIAGIKDTWAGIELLCADGRSLSTRMFCKQDCPTEFIDCDCMCTEASVSFLEFLKNVLPAFIQANDMREDYTIMELKEFASRENKNNM